jgi:glyoxalase family protein
MLTVAPQRPVRGLNGVRHVTGITADVQANVNFWSGVMGFRFIKKTLNFETTFRYHNYFSDGCGSIGSVLTFAWQIVAPRAHY